MDTEHGSRSRISASKIGVALGVTASLSIIALILFRMFFVNFVDNYQVGYKFATWGENKGKIEVIAEPGYIVTPPFKVKVHTIDLRPMQVCINANQRVLNCKLVQFDLKGLELFLSWHGRDDYEGPASNGGSGGNNTGASTTTFSEILKSYAYDGTGKNYPFLKIIRDFKPEDIGDVTQK